MLSFYILQTHLKELQQTRENLFLRDPPPWMQQAQKVPTFSFTHLFFFISAALYLLANRLPLVLFLSPHGIEDDLSPRLSVYSCSIQ